MPKVGLLTISDGRASVHADVGAYALGSEDGIARRTEAARPHVVPAPRSSSGRTSSPSARPGGSPTRGPT